MMSSNVNPKVWGPLFWALLNDIAKYSDNMPKTINTYLSNISSTIPYVLPCSMCREHSRQIYRRNYAFNKVSTSTCKHWLWSFRTEVNKYTHTHNLNYNAFLMKMKSQTAISEKQVVNLLGMISINYPSERDRDNEKRREAIYTFVRALAHIVRYIPHLKSIASFNPSQKWHNSYEFQKWLKHVYKKTYGGELHIH